ncbi:hypothetical protein KCV87_01705 [Actinosynnema pretiosum subsp. pretiosum]|uniref:Uncharacterized protein n=1 Tax=Actinosynnema pretiosum subsp. pretiosum TaxID=103721 RepID=A0AA45L8R9_9PSEU|nr:hypothetical protein APASM_3672 [Actinosynnema pretiosum subsp. pretiosum]QUF04873.1 hypothetical protein KCV87_01705 [Actinosynnema pretiosum subsp. pretiosum]
MTGNHVPAAAGGALAMLAVTVGLLADWPLWGIALLVAAVLGGTALALKAAQDRRLRAWEAEAALRQSEQQQALVPVELPPSGRRVSEVELPSALPNFPLEFACTVHWHTEPDARHGDLGAVAVESVLKRAVEFAKGVQPDDETAGHLLAAELGAPVKWRGLVKAWATGVVLRAPGPERLRLTRARDAHQEQHVWRQRIAAEREVREYYGDEVLASSGSALVWWLAGTDRAAVREAADLVDPLTRLSAVARGELERQSEPIAPEPRDEGAEQARISDFLPEPGTEGSALFADLSARRLLGMDQPERAERWREHYKRDDEGSADVPHAEDALSGAGLNGHGPSTNGTSPNGSGSDGPSPDATARD